ncbi:POK9 protein, partial [Nothoprocta pentlandii]|nr:POK9 protein [Nothoprocta pentlandii]
TGSARVDLGMAVETTLTDSQVQCIPTNVKGPLGYGLSALLLGRSSMTRKGLFVLSGVIDADFTGTISIMVWTPSPPIHIPTGTRTGQLVPFKVAVPLTEDRVRGDGGFGSTGRADIDLARDISKAKPMKWVTLKEPGGKTCKINMLVDAGANVTVVS